MTDQGPAAGGASERETSIRWQPPAVLLVVAVVGAVLGWGYVLTSSDAAGRLLVGTASVLLLVLFAAALRCRPRLAADQHGLVLRGPLDSTRLPWSEIAEIRLVHVRRFGRQAPVLRISTVDEQQLPVELGWLELGEQPEEVAAALTRLRTGR